MTWHFISWVKQGKIIKECLLQSWELHRFLLIRFLYQVIQVRRVKGLCGPVRNFRRFFMQTMTSSTTVAFFVTCLLRVSFFKIFRVKKEICILRLILKPEFPGLVTTCLILARNCSPIRRSRNSVLLYNPLFIYCKVKL